MHEQFRVVLEDKSIKPKPKVKIKTAHKPTIRGCEWIRSLSSGTDMSRTYCEILEQYDDIHITVDLTNLR